MDSQPGYTLGSVTYVLFSKDSQYHFILSVLGLTLLLMKGTRHVSPQFR